MRFPKPKYDPNAPYVTTISDLSDQCAVLKKEGQTLMDALAVFADPNNWNVSCEGDEDSGDECFIFCSTTIDDPIEFAHQVIESLRKKSL